MNSFYKYLEAAFRYKLFNPEGQRIDFDTHYNYLGYNFSFNRIFYYARRVLPKFYIDPARFPNTDEGNLNMARAILQRLDRHLDPELDKYFNSATVAKEFEPVIAAAVKESQATPAQGTASSAGQIPPTPIQSGPALRISIPPAITNIAKNAGSQAGLPIGKFIRRNITPSRIATGITTILGGIVGGGLTGGSSVGILAGAVGGATVPSFIKSGAAGPLLSRAGNGIVNFGVRLSNQTSSRFSPASLISPKKGGLLKVGAAIAIFGLFFGVSLISGIINPSSTPSSEASPVSNGLNYTLPIKDPAVQPVDIRDQIRLSFPQAKLEYWNTIIDTTRAAGLNPALALALWVEETGGSQTTVLRNGGAGIPTSSGALTLGHLGCAPTEDQTITESLICLIKFINNNNFTNSDFAAFMAKYSGGPATDPFSNNPNFTTNFRNWYSKLVPTGAGAIQAVSSTASYTPNAGAGIVSCPLNGVTTITLGSKNAGGHCTAQYQAQEAPCLSGDPTGRASAIDVQSSDKAVFLPTLGGQSANWIVDTTGAINDGGTYVGQDLAATASYKGTSYRIRFVHLDSTELKVGSNYPSGTFVGYYRSTQNHVHITLQEDGVFKDSDLYFNLCR